MIDVSDVTVLINGRKRFDNFSFKMQPGENWLDTKELLLLDEPFQFLDPGNHEKITDYLNEYLDKDVTLIMITHDEKDVQRWTQLRKRL
jgi:ABC-type molybdenum transport system ATPase subunit/photorepair protein PhrA